MRFEKRMMGGTYLLEEESKQQRKVTVDVTAEKIR